MAEANIRKCSARNKTVEVEKKVATKGIVEIWFTTVSPADQDKISNYTIEYPPGNLLVLDPEAEDTDLFKFETNKRAKKTTIYLEPTLEVGKWLKVSFTTDDEETAEEYYAFVSMQEQENVTEQIIVDSVQDIASHAQAISDNTADIADSAHAVNSLATFPVLTTGATGASSTGITGGESSIGQIVDREMQAVLGWRYKPDTKNPKGFLAALGQSFELVEVEGHTESRWRAHGYSVQADMGAITGAQASVFAQTKSMVASAIELLDALEPLGPKDAEADEDSREAIRSLVRTQLNMLVDELGQEAGPRVARVEQIFYSLLGNGINPKNTVDGLLGTLRNRFGMLRSNVNNIEQERSLTNFLIIVDYVISLRGSWEARKDAFSRTGKEPFLGTQFTLLSRALNVIASSIQETYDAMDSVFLDAAQRENIYLIYGEGEQPLYVSELLEWVDNFASVEGPALIENAGREGVESFKSTLEILASLVQNALPEFQEDNPLPPAYESIRVQNAIIELHHGLVTALNTCESIIVSQPHITSVSCSLANNGKRLAITIRGENFASSTTVDFEITTSQGEQISCEANTTFINPTQIIATCQGETELYNSDVVITVDDTETARLKTPKKLFPRPLLPYPWGVYRPKIVRVK